jgi:four helix bundle protein
MPVQHYRAKQKAIDLVELIYTITLRFPREELYCLTKQISRAAVSVPSNIAEGQGRASTGEFRQFLDTARVSPYEVEIQPYVAVRLGYIKQERAEEAFRMTRDVSRMLHGLISALPEKRPSGSNGVRTTSHDSR